MLWCLHFPACVEYSVQASLIWQGMRSGSTALGNRQATKLTYELFAGLLPGLVQVVPSAAISFYVFENTKRLLQVSSCWCRCLTSESQFGLA